MNNRLNINSYKNKEFNDIEVLSINEIKSKKLEESTLITKDNLTPDTKEAYVEEYIPIIDKDKHFDKCINEEVHEEDINTRNYKNITKPINYIKYKQMLMLKRNRESDDMRLVEYINDKYRGVHITVSLLNQETLTGEVVKGFDNILLLKVGDILTHIDGEYIVSFF